MRCIIFYCFAYEVVTASGFLQNPQKLKCPFRVMITLVKIFNEKGRQKHSLCTLLGLYLSLNSAFQLQQTRNGALARNRKENSTFLFPPSEDLPFL